MGIVSSVMKPIRIILLLCVSFIGITGNKPKNLTCGIDKSPASVVYEGIANISNYPWMGVLYYPMRKKRFTTAVVLITKQMVIASANEIDKLPKDQFRTRTKVVLGQRCGEKEISVRDYTYHPDYNSYSHSALAMIQLETDNLNAELHPICPPPEHFMEPQFFALTMTGGCTKPKVRIHRMQYVNLEKCQNYYRRSGLGQDSLWPTHTTCARAVSGGRCLWQGGTVLAIKYHGKWRMLGFSVYGPGCGAPARFLDYGKYHEWVRRSASTIGMPAISRLAENHLIMRRKISNLQRFGPCDDEETKHIIYTDRVQIEAKPVYTAKYNISLYYNVEYSCIMFKAVTAEKIGKGIIPSTKAKWVGYNKPRIYLRRWCAGPPYMCYGFQFLEIHFYVEIYFTYAVNFIVNAYGKHAKILDATRILVHDNEKIEYPKINTYRDVILSIKDNVLDMNLKWFKA